VVRDERGLGLKDRFTDQRPVRVAFEAPEYLRRLGSAGKKSELVARAVRAGADRRVLDCTAGLGRDAFLLAYLGCSVTLVERSPVMFSLLEDGLTRASKLDQLAGAVSRTSLIQADALDVLGDFSGFDVIYLDPMFPAKAGSALVGGEMQVMQKFLGTDQDALSLLEAALNARPERVVLKRPARSDWRPPTQPDIQLKSRTNLFEVYLNSR
jgi:16S rRNA (guanine1516-N2)-methyltransferase